MTKSHEPYNDIDPSNYEIKDFFEFKKERRKQSYDGILGSLPEWVPEPIQLEFERLRDWVLDGWKYEPAEAARLVNQFYDSKEILTRSNKLPSGQEVDRLLHDSIYGYLANLRVAVDLGPKRGIKKLGGSLAERGYQNKNNLQPRSLDDLSKFTDHVYKELSESLSRKPTNREVITSLESFDPNNHLIDEVDPDDEVIYWRIANRKENRLTFKAFYARMTETRKRFEKD